MKRNFTYTKIRDPRLLPLQESIKHEVRLVLVEEDHLRVGVVPGRMEEVLQETVDTVKIYVPANDDKLTLRIDLKFKKD